MQPPISDAALFLKMLVRCPTVLQADVSLPLNVRSEIEVERDVDLINGKQQPFYFEKENLPYEMIQQVLRENDRETLGNSLLAQMPDIAVVFGNGAVAGEEACLGDVHKALLAPASGSQA